MQKPKVVKGNSLVFREVSEQDAEFILGLRLDSEKSKFLSQVSDDLELQRSWLKKYADDDSQVYYVIEYDGKRIGTIRLYDQQGDSFCWGSWILIDSRPKHAAVESALMVYALAVDFLGFKKSHFDVRRGNQKVWEFHERFGAERTSETELDYFYQMSHEAICEVRERLSKFLPNGVVVLE